MKEGLMQEIAADVFVISEDKKLVQCSAVIIDFCRGINGGPFYSLMNLNST